MIPLFKVSMSKDVVQPLAEVVTSGFIGQGPKVEEFEKKINMLPILTKWLTITGSTLRPRSVEEKGNIADQLYKKVWPIIEKKLVMPQIYGTYNLKDANKAHAAIEASDHIGKIILTNT